MRIGIDIDGVLNDFVGFEKKKGLKFFKGKKAIVNAKGFYFSDIFDCTKKEEKSFWKRNLINFFIFISPRPDAVSFLKKARKSGHSIHIITARVFTDSQTFKGWFFRFLLWLWLRKNRVFYDTIDFCRPYTEDKIKYVRYREIDIMVEDSLEEILKIRSAAEVFCYETSYNVGLLPSDIKSIKTFDELSIF